MSEYDAGGHEFSAGHEAYGHAEEHDTQYDALAESHASEHQVDYQHGRHVEYDDGQGGHYEVTEFTTYSQEDAEADSVQAEHYADHDASATYAEADYVHEADQQIEAILHDHGLPGMEHGQLPMDAPHHELPGSHGHGGHSGQGHMGEASSVVSN